ncbi:MAG: hypothetical protein WKF35_07095 [Ferruginibacter sp.]
MEQKNKRRIFLVLLLLLIAFAGWYFIKGKKEVVEGVKLQGITKITFRNPQIRIWDYSAVDGDTIDFYFDDKLIFKNLGLEDSPKIYIPGKLTKGEHTIKIKGISEGMMGPASPHISVSDGKEMFEFDIDAWKDSLSGSWTIIVN